MASRSHTRRVSSYVVAAGLVGIAAAVAAFPFFVGKTAPKVNEREPLKSSAIRRGVFHNSGSKDVGPTDDANPRSTQNDNRRTPCDA